MTGWSLEVLLASLHEDLEHRLSTARRSFAHPDAKGNACENVWLALLSTYLPQRYRASSAYVVDSHGAFSEQMDLVIFDRQYSPFIFTYEQQTIIPAESVYATFEAKQAISARTVAYARGKVASVRALHRTSLPIPHAGGTYPAKEPAPILGGILTLESDWSPPLGDALQDALADCTARDRLDLGCVAAHGLFTLDATGGCAVQLTPKAATAFLFELIARLQAMATVPMIDVRAYARWLT